MSKVYSKRGTPKKNKKISTFQYARMFVIPDSSAKTMNKNAKDKLLLHSTAKTDG